MNKLLSHDDFMAKGNAIINAETIKNPKMESPRFFGENDGVERIRLGLRIGKRHGRKL